MAAKDLVVAGAEALASGRWSDAREAFGRALGEGDSAHAHFGLATALWWLGENDGSVEHATRAYTLFKLAGDTQSALECTVWLAITYKANFANLPAANGWIARGERLLEGLEVGVGHGWLWVTRAYRMGDLTVADALTRRALEVARAHGDIDLELTTVSQLGLISVARGDTDLGFALIDEAMAAALAGEPASLATVVYTCCDMLNACELASDAERAAQWCAVADGFVSRYGCPFLYAECRIYYGSVLTAKGRWSDAERELQTGLRITAGVCPGLHQRALTRLAALRLRQGRIEDAGALLADLTAVRADAEVALAASALLLAKGDAASAARLLRHRWSTLEEHRSHVAAALDLLVEAHLVAGELEAADSAAERLSVAVAATESPRLRAVAEAAGARVLLARGDHERATSALESAASTFSELGLPFEEARVQLDIGRAFAPTELSIAVEHARRALTVFEQLGAHAHADLTAAFLRSIGGGARTGPKGVGTLTQREQEVLRLLGLGQSNPEIAERLHISRKTASHHVSSVLAKLNLRNRAEAAAFASRMGQVPDAL